MNFLFLHLVICALASYAVAQPSAPAAPASSVTAAPAAAATPVPPDKMDSKTLLYPRTTVKQEIEIGAAVVPAVISQLLAGMTSGAGTPDPSETKRLQEMLSSEAVRTALNGMTRLLVVSMVPTAADVPPGGTPAALSYEGDKVAAHYGDLFAQHGWASAIRTVEPQSRKSFHLLLGPEGKGLFFAVADQYGITTVLALSETSLRPMLDVLAPILGKGIFPTGLPTPSTSTAPAAPR